MKKNLVVHSRKTLQSYHEYGISIPMKNSRVDIPFFNARDKYQIEETPIEQFGDITLNDLELCHTKSFIEKIKNDPELFIFETYELLNEDGSFNRYDPSKKEKPLFEFIEKGLLHVNGTFLSAKNALENGFCYHLGGGMHHAMSHRSGGFCMFNDIVLSIRKLQKLGLIKKAIVIDMDAHKGDGTAQMTIHDETILTYSIHMKEGWPLNNPKNEDSFLPSNVDVGVLSTDNYLDIFKSTVSDFVRANSDEKIDLCIVVHGADVYEHDELESANLIKLTLDEVFSRDQFIFNLLRDSSIPQAWVMAGGYGERVHEVFWQFLDFALEQTLD